MRSLLTLALATPLPAQAPEPIVLEVTGADFVRHEPLAHLRAPTVPIGHLPRLFDLDGEKGEVPAQIDPVDGALVWPVTGDLAPDAVRRYRLEWTPGEAPRASRPTNVPQRLDAGGRAIACYVTGSEAVLPDLPAGVDPLYRRTGYLHPIWTPAGRVVTGDYPASHRHQHGVMTAWTRTAFRGRDLDFWNTAERQAHVEHRRFIDRWTGPVIGSVGTKLWHVDETDVFPETALEETWLVRVRAAPRWNTVDLSSWQVAYHQPLALHEYHYGGFAYRAPEAWEGEDGVRIRTSEGHERAEADGDRARWVAFSGELADEDVTVAILGHPGSYRAPQPVRVHPSNPYVCFSPCRLGPFEITREQPLFNAYRFVLADETLDDATIEALWQDYARPLEARIVE